MATASPFQRFAAFLKDKGWSQTDAARELGCSQVMISHLIRQQRRPGRDLADAIELRTARWKGGRIRSGEWRGASVDVKATGTDGS